jgi:hypothetical protein
MEASSAVPVAGARELERVRPGEEAAPRSASEVGTRVSRREQRAAPGLLAGLAVAAGIGAVALGIAAFLVGQPGRLQSPVISPEAQSALSLLAKPSTERVPLGGSAGTAVLAVGSGGRAAIVLKGFAPAPAGSVYYAWVRSEPGRFAEAGTFTGTERVVLLSRRVERGGVVAVTSEATGVAAPSAPPQLVAIRP